MNEQKLTDMWRFLTTGSSKPAPHHAAPRAAAFREAEGEALARVNGELISDDAAGVCSFGHEPLADFAEWLGARAKELEAQE